MGWAKKTHLILLTGSLVDSRTLMRSPASSIEEVVARPVTFTMRVRARLTGTNPRRHSVVSLV